MWAITGPNPVVYQSKDVQFYFYSVGKILKHYCDGRDIENVTDGTH